LKDWLTRHPAEKSGVIHCFNETLATAQEYLRMGFYISLGGYIGYPSARPVREVVKSLPLNRLLLETDCPFLPPQAHRGQRNEPAYLPETAIELAKIKGVSIEEAADVTSGNARALFGIPG
jgi:TatD DNase family protein